jgi:hypothetical protein
VTKVRRVRRPKVSAAPPSIVGALRFFAVLVFIFVNMLPFNMTAVGPLIVHVVDADKNPVPGACVTELWPAYSSRAVPGAVVDTVATAAWAVTRADSMGVSHLPSRSATASGFRRMRDAIPRLVSRVLGGTPPPTVRVTVLGPGYQGEARDLKPKGGIVSIVTRTDVQSRTLRQRFSRSCVP